MLHFLLLSRPLYFLLKADMLPSCGAGASSAKWWTWDRIGWHGAFVSVLIYKEESRQRKGTEEREKKLLPDQTLCCCSFFFAFLIFPLTWWCLPLHPLCHCLGCVFMYLLPMSQGSIYCSFYLSRCEKAEWNNNNKKEEEMFIKLIKTGIVFYL